MAEEIRQHGSTSPITSPRDSSVYLATADSSNPATSSQLSDQSSESKTETSSCSSYIPGIKPPHFEDGFIDNVKEDLSIISGSAPLYLLSAGSIVNGMSLGANDFANAMGTSVGSGVLTFPQARILAGNAVLYGSTFGGQKTASTVKSSIWDLKKTSLEANDVQIGMSAALIGSSVWIAYATKFGWPVSTTQSTIGGVVGVGAVADAIKTNDSGRLLNGVNGETLLKLARSWGIAPVAGVAGSIAIYTLMRPFYKYTQFNPVMNWIWQKAPILSGVAVAYSIGRNDTGHVVGLVAGGIDSAKKHADGESMASNASVNQWLSFAGGAMILMGMWNFGSAVVDTLGSRIGGMNPAKALSAELATAIVVNGFSELGLPISSSHTIVGAVTGIALASAEKPPWFFLGRVMQSWVLSIPVSAVLAGGAYAAGMSVAAIDRDAPPVEDHGASSVDSVAVTAMRAEKYIDEAAKITAKTADVASDVGKAARLAGALPIGAAGFAAGAVSVAAAAKEGPRQAFAQGAKVVVECAPVVGGLVQAADGIYGLVTGKSWWTGLEMSRGEAAANVGLGLGFTALDIAGPGLIVKAFKGVKAAGRAIGGLIRGSEEVISHADDVSKAAEAAKVTYESISKGEDAVVAASRITEPAATAAKETGKKAGVIERMRTTMSRAAKNEAEGEAARKEIGQFVGGTVDEVYDSMINHMQMGRVSRVLAHDGVTSSLQKASKKIAGEISVNKHQKLLAEKIAREFSDRPELVRIATEALEKAHPTAMLKSNSTYLERAILWALKGNAPRNEINGLLKVVRKEVPEGMKVLSDDAARSYYAGRMRAEGTKLAELYSREHWRLKAKMGLAIGTEPLTLGMTFRGAKAGFGKLRGPAKPVFDTVGRFAGDWFDTLNPIRSIKRSIAS